MSIKTLIGLLFAAMLAIGGSLATAGAASASTSPGADPVSADNVHFTSTYNEGTSVPGHVVTWHCAGERIANNGQGTRDVEECTLTGDTGDYAKGTYGNPAGVFGTFPGFPPSVLFFWFSDFDGKVSNGWQITVNGASNHAHVDATYP